MAGCPTVPLPRGTSAPSIAEALFENLAHVVAQSEVDGERFRALGARPVTVSGNLKVDTDPPPADEKALGRADAPDRLAKDVGGSFHA